MFQFKPSRPERSDRRRRIDSRIQKIGNIAGHWADTAVVFQYFVADFICQDMVKVIHFECRDRLLSVLRLAEFYKVNFSE